MIQRFIAKHGVTKCPGMGTPELAEHNAKKAREWEEMSWAKKRAVMFHGRKPTLTPDERREKRKAYAREYYHRRKARIRTEGATP